MSKLSVMPWLQLRCDYDTTTMHRARLLPFDVSKKMNVNFSSYSCRSRIVVESQLRYILKWTHTVVLSNSCSLSCCFYLYRRLTSGECIVSLGVHLSRCHAVCVSAALVSAAKVMRCIQFSLVSNEASTGAVSIRTTYPAEFLTWPMYV